MDRVSTKQRREASRLYKDARDRLETKTEMRGIVFLQRREGSKQKQRCEASRFYKDARDRVSIKQRREASRLYCEGSRFYKNRDARHRVSTKTGCWRIKKCLLFLAIFLAVVEPIDGRKRRWHSIMPDVFLVQ